MKFLIGFFLVLSVHFSGAHDIKVAYFEISQEKSDYKMLVRFDRGDILTVLDSYEDLKKSLGSYLKGHLSLLFDGKRASWEVLGVEITDLFITVDCRFDSKHSNVTTINVWNTSLVNSIEGHDNVIVTRLHDRKRSFRLNRERQQTTIKY